jgi:IS6 family transposase
MRACPRCSSAELTRDGHDERGRVVYTCAGCGRHATTDSASLVSGHRFPSDVILLAVRYYLQLGVAAERIAGVLADRGIDVSGRTILRWVQKFGPALADAVRQGTYAAGHDVAGGRDLREDPREMDLYRGVDLDGQVLDCWLSATRDLPAAEAFFRRTIESTGCTPEHIVTDKAAFYPSAIRAHAPDARHTATGFYNRVISTNRCERNHSYVKARLRPMRGLKSFDCAKRLLPALDALQVIERGFVAASRAALPYAAGRVTCAPAGSQTPSIGSADVCRTRNERTEGSGSPRSN